MNLEAFISRLAAIDKLDDRTSQDAIRAKFSAFQRETGSSDIWLFIDSCFRSGVIGAGTYARLVGTVPVSTLPYEPSEAKPAPEQPVQVIPEQRHTLLGVIGRGGMGEVRIAYDNLLLRRVAHKSILPDVAKGQAKARFLAEARITAQLSHPSIVPVYALESTETGEPAYTMKWVRGRTLHQIIRQAREEVTALGKPNPAIGLNHRLDMFVKVCEALDYAHALGVVHRDLKPENIMVGAFGEVYVMDWGLSRVIDEPQTEVSVSVDQERVVLSESQERLYARTKSGSLLGTIGYMSPEQASGKGDELDPQSDMYTLGLILQELVYLEHAVFGTERLSEWDMIERHQSGQRRPMRGERVGEPVPRDLPKVIDRACDPNPAHRYTRALDLAEDIRRAQRDEEPIAIPDNWIRGGRRWFRHHASRVMITLSMLLMLGSIAYIYEEWVTEARAEANAALEARNIAHFRAVIQKRADWVNATLARYEGLLDGLVEVTEFAMARGTTPAVRLYPHTAFDNPALAPPDVQQVDGWNLPISKQYPMFAVNSSEPEQAWRHQVSVGTLVVMGHRGLVGQAPIDDLPVRWIYLGFEASGAMVMYPGSRGTLAETFDVRNRDWYQEVAAEVQQTPPQPGPPPQLQHPWSRPYQDGMGQGIVLSCRKPFFDRKGRFLGVAALDIEWDDLLKVNRRTKKRVEAGQHPNLDWAAFLDQGELLVVAESTPDDVDMHPLPTPKPLASFDGVPAEVIHSIEHQETGQAIRKTRDGTRWLWVWTTLDHHEQVYLVKANLDSLFVQPDAAPNRTPEG